MLTERDRKIIRFIEDFGCADSDMIHRLFFADVSRNRCLSRMKQLADRHCVSRSRESVSANYLYYIGKPPKEIAHKMVRANFYTRMKASYDLKVFFPEPIYGKIRPDAYMEFSLYGQRYAAFLEVQLSSGDIQAKYEAVYNSGKWQERWTSFPLVIIVTPHKQKIKPSKVKYITVDSGIMSMDAIRDALYSNAIQRNTFRAGGTV